jgi:hypothetical protein
MLISSLPCLVLAKAVRIKKRAGRDPYITIAKVIEVLIHVCRVLDSEFCFIHGLQKQMLNEYKKVSVTFRLKVSQSVSLGVEPHLRLMTRYLLLFNSYCRVIVGRPL